MGSLQGSRCACVAILVLLFLLLLLPACGGHKPAGASNVPAKITLNPSSSVSLQMGTTLAFTASATNSGNTAIAATFTYALTPDSAPGILDISPTGFACAGTWNAPNYNICTPAGIGVVQVTASALGQTSPPTYVYVHPPIASIEISVVPPVNSPPPACPSQTALPAACNLPFKATNSCLSTNQVQTLQAIARDSHGTDITASVGPFFWSQTLGSVAKLTPIVSTTSNLATNQVTAEPNVPGQTQITASAAGVASAPYNNFETCPVQCIALDLSANGVYNGTTSFVVNKGTSRTITAAAVDVQGCIVPKPPLTWTSSSPAAIAAGSSTTGCAAGSTCSVSTTQPGAAAITASCTPPTCNVGYPLNLNGVAAPYIPQPVYPVTAISGLVTGTTTSQGILASSRDCYSVSTCSVALWASTTGGGAPFPTPMPTPPNSVIFDASGDKAYTGSQFGALLITTSKIGGASSPFTTLPATATPLGVVTGKVLASSLNGALAVFSDTVSTPNQVFLVNTSSSTPVTTALNINSATAAAFSPDNLKAFILGDGGNTLYVYSTLQSLQTYGLTAPAGAIAFSSTGTFALLAGGSSSSSLALRNTCDNSAVNLPITNLLVPPTFLKMVPPGNVSMGNAVIPMLKSPGLDIFFGLDNTGIDIIATNTSQPPATLLCPQPISLAETTQNTIFEPVHINLGRGTFQPIAFFLSPDATQVYVVTSDQGVLVYNFNTQSVSAIPIEGGAAPLAADITVDGSLIYVAATDGLLHKLVTATATDEQPSIAFNLLVNSSSSFCYTSDPCVLNMVAVKP